MLTINYPRCKIISLLELLIIGYEILLRRRIYCGMVSKAPAPGPRMVSLDKIMHVMMSGHTIGDAVIRRVVVGIRLTLSRIAQ